MRMIRATEMQLCEPPAIELGAGLPYWSRTCIAGITFELRTNVEGLADAFSARYSDHPAVESPAFRYYVRADAAGYVFWCEHGPARRWDGPLPVDAVLFLTDAVAISALIHFDPALASMHAAGVSCGGAAAAIVADSEGGKTTTAWACAHAGMQVYSDERVLLRGNVVHPFLRRFRLREGGATLLGIDVPPESSWTGTFGKAVRADAAPLRALFVIAGREDNARVEPLEETRALAAALRWFDSGGYALERIARAFQIVRSVDCYALHLGDPYDTASCIGSVLQRKTTRSCADHRRSSRIAGEATAAAAITK